MLGILLTSCSISESCVESGGYPDEEKKCVCDVYNEKGLCRERTLEHFISRDLPKVEITTGYLGIQRKLTVDSVEVENIEFVNDDKAYHIFAPTQGWAISIPDYPDRISDKWTYKSCEFVRAPDAVPILKTKRLQFGFRATCENSAIITTYWTTKNLNLIAFSIEGAPPDMFFKGSEAFLNSWFIPPNGLFINTE